MRNNDIVFSVLLYAVLIFLASISCVPEGLASEDPAPADLELCEIRFECGRRIARTLSLEAETPVECVVYQRAYGKGNAFESPETIYIVRGVIPAGGKRVDITDVNSASADRLLVPRRKSYDILFLVNDSPRSELYDEDGELKDGIFGSLNFNVISGLGHGSDVMAGEKTTYVDDGIFKAMVRFKSLRHLGTAIAVEVRTGDGF